MVINGDASFLEKSLYNLSIDIKQDDEIYIASPLAKKAKCSTPLTKVSNSHTKAELSEQDIILNEMNMLLPNILNEMKKNGYLETRLNLNRMMNDCSFPFDNIAFLLFIAVCRFLSCKNTSGIRYSDKVKHFWHIGFRIFHGKWLKFTSGPKHTGTLTTEQSDKRIFSPAFEKIKNEGPMII